ncbi:MAG: SLC13 family permease [Candidatus Kapabacteria bacterium]|nr:SLC13 family permease [Candidatus Kapabacteria bacterium]
MEQVIVFATLFIVLVLFAWGRIRHDFVALIALFILVIAGIVAPADAFLGFGHPAVITVAAVLIIGKGIEYSGLMDLLGKWMMKLGNNVTVQLLGLTTMTGIASAFMNNVGALAIMMPIAIHLARKSGNPPSYFLMPIAFASLLGGMTTLIGTPPNIIASSFRMKEFGTPFQLFDFAPVGVIVLVVGILFISLVGWRLLPKRFAEKSEKDLFNIDDYITEVRVTARSKMKNSLIENLKKSTKTDIQILGLIRHNERIHAPDPKEELQVDDIIIIETDADELSNFLESTDFELVGGKTLYKEAGGSEYITTTEAIVMADSPLVGQTATSSQMRTRFEVNLLAVARRETKIHRRLDQIIFRTGDVLLLQGKAKSVDEVIKTIGCLPLARRGLRLGYQKKILLTMSIFIASILLVVFNLLEVQVAFSLAAVTMILSGILPLKDVYTSIDWPVIVLLGAMIPVGMALETSGGAATIGMHILNIGDSFPTWAMIAIVLYITMTLSDVINNAATVVIMAPIALNVAHGLGVNSDAFIMAVAVGGSCAFLTPIGHQSNTLVMGPGGYRFTDYWRMGLPLDILVILISVPLIMYFWL